MTCFPLETFVAKTLDIYVYVVLNREVPYGVKVSATIVKKRNYISTHTLHVVRMKIRLHSSEGSLHM